MPRWQQLNRLADEFSEAASTSPGAERARLRGRAVDATTPLADCPGLSWQLVPPECVHGYKDLAVRFRKPEQRVAAEAALAAAGVMTKRYFFPVHRMEVYREFTNRFLPVTDQLHERLLCIPLYYDLSDDRIDDIAGIIRRSLGLGSTHHYAA